jgi:hypothetical protein
MDSILFTPRVAWSQAHDHISQQILPLPTRTLGESSRRPQASSQVSSAVDDGLSIHEANPDHTMEHRARLAALWAR